MGDGNDQRFSIAQMGFRRHEHGYSCNAGSQFCQCVAGAWGNEKNIQIPLWDRWVLASSIFKISAFRHFRYSPDKLSGIPETGTVV